MVPFGLCLAASALLNLLPASRVAPKGGRPIHLKLLVGQGPGATIDFRDIWWRGHDSNVRPSGYEPDELPDCSTPHQGGNVVAEVGFEPT